MYKLGKKNEVRLELTKINLTRGRPVLMPRLNNETLICGYDQGLGECFLACETLEDMQTLYDAYARGDALNIRWYKAKKIDYVKSITLEPDETVVRTIIKTYAPDVTEEVKETLIAYAMGNYGVARVLSELAKSFTSATQVEKLVGWPLIEHTPERAGSIWIRFK